MEGWIVVLRVWGVVAAAAAAAAAVGESGRRLGEPVVVGLVVVAGGLATACVCTGCRARLSAPSLLVRGRIPRSL